DVVLSFGGSAGAIITCGVTLVALAAGLFIVSLKMVRGIVGDFTRHTIAMSQGNLATEIRVVGHAASTAATRALKGLQEETRKTIGSIRSGTHEVSTASTEIATGNQDLSQRTETTPRHLAQNPP